jgi:hypothetical protein
MRLFLLLCGLILLVTMPNTITPGDCYASRAEAANLVMTGEWGIAFARMAEITPINEKRGEFFFANDAKERLFNKWGIMNTILYLPPMLATRLITGSVGLMDQSRTHLFFVNLNNVLLAMLILWHLDKILSLYTPHPGRRMMFITLAVFTTYLWFHLRSQMHEIFQLTMAMGFLHHFLRSLRAAANRDPARRWRHLGLAMLWAGGLLLTKALYVTVIAAAWLFAWLAGPGEISLTERIKENVTRNFSNMMRYLLLPTALVLALFLAVNYHKTGSCLDAGYSQEQFTGVNEVDFSPAVLKESIPGFLVLPGNANLFLHFPLLVLALFGLRRFSRHWPLEAGFIAFTVASNFLIIACYQTWRGEWADGPRYLIIFALMASLPAVEAMAALAEQVKKPLARGAAILFAVVSLWSGVTQLADNSMENFSFYYYEGFFQQFDDPDINNYFTRYLTRGVIYSDILAYRYAGRPFYPIEVMRQKHPEWYRENGKRLQEGVTMGARLNYFFVRAIMDLWSRGTLNAPPATTNG